MKHVAKKNQSVDFKNTDDNKIIDRDINSLIRELKEQDAKKNANVKNVLIKFLKKY